MDRVIYCPTEDQLTEAEALAKEWLLPIQIGDSPRTEKIDFNRKEVIVVTVPVDVGFVPAYFSVEMSVPFTIVYLNDFIDCSSLSFQVFSKDNSTVVKSVRHDKHRIGIPLSIEVSGDFVLKCFDGDNVLDEMTISVKQ